jgi:hypothetical protein
MNPRFSSLKHLILIATAFFFAAGCFSAISAPHMNPANDLSRDTASELLLRHSTETAAGRLGETPAFADFDGDQKGDVAIARLVKDQYEIVVSLSRRSEEAVLNPSTRLAGFIVHAYDINNDSYQDVVVTDAIAKLPLEVWLGDGRGNFEIADKSLFRTCFEFAEPSRYRSAPLASDQDLFDETTGPSFGKAALLTIIPDLNQAGFKIPSTHFRTIRITYSSTAPRSPPTIHP